MRINILHFITLIISLNACIDPYTVEFNRNNKVLVVEGLLTDNFEDPDTIKIRYSTYYDGAFNLVPIPALKPSITIVETKKEIPLVEYATGSFLPPKGFKILPNESYQLRFSIDGQQYESSPESITQTPPIARIYEKFNPKSKLAEDGKEFVVANDVFVNFNDIPNQRNYYKWRYIHFEEVYYCETCYRYLYSKLTESCTIPAPAYYTELYYDYTCLNDCYAIIKAKEINVMTDQVSDGQLVSGRLVAKIPYFEPGGCLVEIQQMCISSDAYLFYKNLETQSKSSGGLADTPPAAIVGNIKNITNFSEKIVGFFGVANIQKKRIWIDRKETKGRLELVLGHIIKEEPVTPNRPPSARCKKTTFRTPFKPEGWQ
jgi:Domain of unknown function (DUF4249)